MSVTYLHVQYALTPTIWDACGRLGLDGRKILFEYDPFFEHDLSPLRMPRRRGVVVGPSDPLEGLMGLFDDSIPDGWGRMLIDRNLSRWHDHGTHTALDRLREVGYRAIGALRYHGDSSEKEPPLVDVPALARHVEAAQLGDDAALDEVTWLCGAFRGRAPKAAVQITPTGDTRSGAGAIWSGNVAWLVKFRALGEDQDTAQLHHAYYLMAKAAGLNVPRTQLLGATPQSPGHFAIERFDYLRVAGRIHTHTLGGLLHLPRGPAGLDYRDVLGVTRQLTRNEAAVAQMFRRACFDVFAHNRDVHSRSFAFLMNEDGEWRPSPSYGLTFSPDREHAMPIAGQARAPDASHLRLLGTSMDLKRVDRIIHEVRAAIARFSAFADEAGVPAKLRRKVVEALGAAND